MTQEGSYACSRGGESFDEGEYCLGQGESVPEMVRRGEGGGEPVT